MSAIQIEYARYLVNNHFDWETIKSVLSQSPKIIPEVKKSLLEQIDKNCSVYLPDLRSDDVKTRISALECLVKYLDYQNEILDKINLHQKEYEHH